MCIFIIIGQCISVESNFLYLNYLQFGELKKKNYPFIETKILENFIICSLILLPLFHFY